MGSEFIVYVGKHRVGKVIAKNRDLALIEARKLFPSPDVRVRFARMYYVPVVANVHRRLPFQA